MYLLICLIDAGMNMSLGGGGGVKCSQRKAKTDGRKTSHIRG